MSTRGNGHVQQGHSSSNNNNSATNTRTRRNKERSKNFTELEKRTVLELIAQHREVLRQGRSNNATNKNKQMVWSQICLEVNKRCRAENPRTPAQVKMWYENFKKKCKMRYMEPGAEETQANLLDGMLWTSLNPLSETLPQIKDERRDTSVIMSTSEEHMPVNMSSERLERARSSDIDKEMHGPTPLEILDQQMTVSHSPIPRGPPTPLHHINPAPNVDVLNESNGPLNLSHLEPKVCIDTPPPAVGGDGPFFSFQNQSSKKQYSRTSHGCASTNSAESHNNGNNGGGGNGYFCAPSLSPTEEEKLYFIAKRQHSIWEHEAKMKILNMELRQKEEIFSLQKQLFLIELKLKMDYLEKNCSK